MPSGSVAKNWMANEKSQAGMHRQGQIDRSAGIADLTNKQRAELLEYVKKTATNLWKCQHLVTVHKQIPHPKYGDRVPNFEAVKVPDPMVCPCEEAQRFRAELLGE